MDPAIIHVVLEVRTDSKGDDHVVVVGAFDDETKIPTIEDAAKLYGKAFARNVVKVFLNVNQGAPGLGIGKHPQ